MLNTERAIGKLEGKCQGIHVHGRAFIAGWNVPFVADVVDHTHVGVSQVVHFVIHCVLDRAPEGCVLDCASDGSQVVSFPLRYPIDAVCNGVKRDVCVDDEDDRLKDVAVIRVGVDEIVGEEQGDEFGIPNPSGKGKGGTIVEDGTAAKRVIISEYSVKHRYIRLIEI